MAKIHQLAREVAELIAAGEVVERPASIVKELVENAIDAGSTRITVAIERGGIRLIRVSDDGCGIAAEDIPTAFLRHATSKVSTGEDLERIGTLGFRGEALCSIAAVSRVELATRTADEVEGHRYTLAGGEGGQLEPAGCPVGTTIVVRDVFFNLPARMKFLKKDATEGSYITDIVEKLAVSHPEVAFTYLRDGQRRFSTPGSGRLRDAVHAVWGAEFARCLLPVQLAQGALSVQGLITPAQAGRATRGMQHFYVNRRYIRSKSCQAALEAAYKNEMPARQFPGCVLFLTVDLGAVDVNVHPAKTEVRFSDENQVFSCVYSACKAALSQHQQRQRLAAVSPRALTPFDLEDFDYRGQQQSFPAPQPAAPAPPRPADGDAPPSTPAGEGVLSLRSGGRYALPVQALKRALDIAVEPSAEGSLPARAPLAAGEEREAASLAAGGAAAGDPAPPAPGPEAGGGSASREAAQPPQLPPLRLVGELFDTYALFQGEDRLLLVDKHAAHERHNYNLLRQQLGHLPRQLLLAPVPVRLAAAEYAAALAHREVFAQLGIQLEDWGEQTVVVREIPLLLDPAQAAQTVSELAGKLAGGDLSPSAGLMDSLLYSVACRASVMAGRESRPQELEELLHLLAQEEQMEHCPHGRPIYQVITKGRLAKWFGR